MRVLVGVLLALLLAGCTTTRETILIQDGASSSGTIHLDLPSGAELEPHEAPAKANETIPVTLPDGSNATASKLYIREITERDSRGRTLARAACSGAVLGTPEGAPDPRDRLGSLAYADSIRVVDPGNRTWVIDRYTQDDNDTLTVWAVNVHGGAFRPDDGRHCEPLWHGMRAYNAVLYTEVVGLDLHFAPDARPAEPGDRSWSVEKGNGLPAEDV